MGIADELYERCRYTTAQARAVLERLCKEQPSAVSAVTARRLAADIAADTTAALLVRAFVTPIDREDLWLWRTVGETVLRRAEDVGLYLVQCKRALPPMCAAAVQAAAKACGACEAAAERMPHCETCITERRAVREAQRVCYETAQRFLADITVRRVCEQLDELLAVCDRLLDTAQYITVKNS